MTKLSEIIKSHEEISTNENILPSLKEKSESTVKVLKEVEEAYGEMVTYDESFERVEDETVPDELAEPASCLLCRSEIEHLQVFYKGTNIKAVYNIKYNPIDDDYHETADKFASIDAITCQTCSFTGFDQNQSGLENPRLMGNVLVSINEFRGKTDEV